MSADFPVGRAGGERLPQQPPLTAGPSTHRFALPSEVSQQLDDVSQQLDGAQQRKRTTYPMAAKLTILVAGAAAPAAGAMIFLTGAPVWIAVMLGCLLTAGAATIYAQDIGVPMDEIKKIMLATLVAGAAALAAVLIGPTDTYKKMESFIPGAAAAGGGAGLAGVLVGESRVKEIQGLYVGSLQSAAQTATDMFIPQDWEARCQEVIQLDRTAQGDKEVAVKADNLFLEMAKRKKQLQSKTPDQAATAELKTIEKKMKSLTNRIETYANLREMIEEGSKKPVEAYQWLVTFAETYQDCPTYQTAMDRLLDRDEVNKKTKAFRSIKRTWQMMQYQPMKDTTPLSSLISQLQTECFASKDTVNLIADIQSKIESIEVQKS